MSLNQSLLDHIAIILIRPKYPENIGAAARAAWNMGLTRIIVVADEYPDHDRMTRMATHNAVHLINSMEFHQDLAVALEPFSQIIATTARRGRQRIRENNPREIMRIITPMLYTNQVAFLFGPENNGLSNEELKYCQLLSAIPTAAFSSLNLAQAVGIHCYEIYHALIHDKKDITPSPKIAKSFELESMYTDMEKTLLKIDLLEEKNQTYYMRKLRQFFGRIQLNSGEAHTIRSICRQFHRHAPQTGENMHQRSKL